MDEPKLAATTVQAVANLSVHIMAVAIVFASVYFASSIVITLVVAALIAFTLEPAVVLLERVRVPRWLGSLVMVLLALAVVYVIGYLIYDRAVAFMQDLPKLSARLKQLVAHIQLTTKNIQQSTTMLPASPEANLPAVRLQQEYPWGQFLLRGIGSAYAFAVTVMFVPFLVFFMLTSRNHIWMSTLNLFPVERRQQAEDVMRGISKMVRSFMVGNLLVAVISAGLITPIFALVGLRYALVVGPIAAFLSLVPYVGVALAVLPPLLIALVQFDTMGPFLSIALTVVFMHFIAVNVLTPPLVGHRVKLNALTVTISMMFWGWLWGAIGLVLAIPITAAVKAVCDNVDRLKPYGDWMGES